MQKGAEQDSKVHHKIHKTVISKREAVGKYKRKLQMCNIAYIPQ